MSPTLPVSLLVFSLDQRRFALHLAEVEQVIRAVEITTLPGAPADVLGVINIRGRVVPVISARAALDFPARELQLSDNFIVATAGDREVALVADEVHGLVHLSEQDVIKSEAIASDLAGIEGIAQLGDGLVVIENLPALIAATQATAVPDE